MNRMRDTRDQFMVPKMGQIQEDHTEEFGTYKANNNAAFKLPSDIRKYDSLLDSASLALD